MHRAPTTRLVFMDNLRVFLTVLVVAHHAAQPYGPTGGEWPLFNPERAAILGPFFAVNAAFFMGLFFFISGYFLPAMCDRKGVNPMLRERFRRLGIPILFFALMVFPAVLYGLARPPVAFPTFVLQRYIQQRDIEVAHLWFLMHLLSYTLVYGLWRRVARANPLHKLKPPGPGLVIAYMLGLSLITFLVRIQYPIDRWIHLFGVLPTEMAHLPQYVSLFFLGIAAYRHRWLWQMPPAQGMAWFGVGLGAGVLRYGYSLARVPLALPDLIAGGGGNWRALVWSSWEAVICIGLCVGLLVLFRDRANVSSPRLKWLSANAYGVYLIHLLVIVGVQLLVAPLAIGPLAKFGLVMLTGTPLCFALSATLRRLPWIRFVVS